MQRANERRDLARVNVAVPVHVEWAGKQASAMISDLAIGGAFIRCSISPPSGAYVHLLLNHTYKPLFLIAIVRWGDERGFGAQFVYLSAYETSIIASHLARAHARHG